ncbi:MAG: hypothetical protein IIA77_01180 [Proteobacteria bacterium]|nr:hypothetical protein [Pseudomonadota bacterium]
MAQEERRISAGQRLKSDRRENGSSMISGYANYSGPERRKGKNRRVTFDRRAETP